MMSPSQQWKHLDGLIYSSKWQNTVDVHSSGAFHQDSKSGHPISGTVIPLSWDRMRHIGRGGGVFWPLINIYKCTIEL